jgi:hypothetical protein
MTRSKKTCLLMTPDAVVAGRSVNVWAAEIENSVMAEPPV